MDKLPPEAEIRYQSFLHSAVQAVASLGSPLPSLVPFGTRMPFSDFHRTVGTDLDG
jgi:hypothetical protein